MTKTIILLLGGLITCLCIGHTDARTPVLCALAIGFGIVTLSALLAGVAHQLLGVSLAVGIFINSILTALGFVIITYSLYVD